MARSWMRGRQRRRDRSVGTLTKVRLLRIYLLRPGYKGVLPNGYFLIQSSN